MQALRARRRADRRDPRAEDLSPGAARDPGHPARSSPRSASARGRSARCSRTRTSRWALVRERDRGDPEEVRRRAAARRSRSDEAEEVEYTADDFIVEEDNVVIVSRDGWVKRQKEVKDLATTRLREGDAVLAVLPGSTRATVGVLHATSASPTRAASSDVPASTGYGEPIQRCSSARTASGSSRALSLDPRVAATIAAKKEGAEPPVHALAVTSDGYSLRFSLEPFVEPSTRAGRRYARAAEGAEVVGVGDVDRQRDDDRRHARGARDAVQGRRGQLPVRPGPRRHPDQARSTTTIACSGSSPRPAIAI